MALGLAFAGTVCAATVTTLGGGPRQGNPLPHGYADGDTLQVSQFNFPMGIALDSTESLLFVADFTNNAVRVVDLSIGLTRTFATRGVTYNGNGVPVATNAITRPVDVKLDADDNVYVLTRGNGNNGAVLKFDKFANFLGVRTPPLTNASALALAGPDNFFVAVRSNTIVRFSLQGTNTVAVITNAGAWLRGMVVMDDNKLAVTDAGNHGVWMIDYMGGLATNYVRYVGFKGAGDVLGNTNFAKFNQPHFIARAGSSWLVVADRGNHRVKIVDASRTVRNLYGVCSNLWVGPYNPAAGIYPGWYDGDGCQNIVQACDYCNNYAEAREPVGIAVKSDGTVFTTEVFYHLIRQAADTGLPSPPPPPPPPAPVSAPVIGWVDYQVDSFGNLYSVLRTGTSFSFNNDVTIAIFAQPGTLTYYTYGPTPVGLDTIPAPNAVSGSTPPHYQDGLRPDQVPPSIAPMMPDLTVKAMSTKVGMLDSPITKARFQFVTATPTIVGDNAALFTLNNITTGAEMWYTWDGTDPTNGPPSIGPVFNGAQISTNLQTGTLTFKVRAFKANYAPSGIAVKVFSATNFQANRISFGFESGEASSDFVASAGQFFYAPVTLSVLQGVNIYSLQFNVTATNLGAAPLLIPQPGYLGFTSMLMEKLQPVGGVDLYRQIPPGMFVNYLTDPPPTNNYSFPDRPEIVDLRFINNSLNLIGVGWLERRGKTNLFDTSKQDLITYSIAHDTVFDKKDGRVVVGGYAFRVPTNAQPGHQYQIRLGRPSATSDGVGAPGSEVYIEAPTNGSLGAGAINAVKLVTVGQRMYVAGDVHPFRWFNAGDFGDTNIVSADVMQVFQSAIYGLNNPPHGSDFFDAMDSCCGALASVPAWGQIVFETDANLFQSPNDLFNGNDTMINSIAFGDGELDVTDVYVTFRRSLDPCLNWYQRFWTNGVRAARLATNVFRGTAECPPNTTMPAPLSSNATAVLPAVAFSLPDRVASAGQTIQLPVTAQTRGDHPVRVLMLNISVRPLDGSPALSNAVQFTPAPALGQPTLTHARSINNCAVAWLDGSVQGLAGSNVVLGTLTIRVPAGAPTNAAYAVHFDHASASPNGIAPFPKRVRTGLVTLSERSQSSWGDGIPDSWRLRHFGSINNILSAATADADGDGLSNIEEYHAGTDPNDTRSNLKLSSAPDSAGGGGIVIRWPSAVGKRYVVEVSPTLHGPLWMPVATNTGTGWDVEYRDSRPGPGPRFYRVRLLE